LIFRPVKIDKGSGGSIPNSLYEPSNVPIACGVLYPVVAMVRSTPGFSCSV
jgi:hypothetical protein